MEPKESVYEEFKHEIVPDRWRDRVQSAREYREFNEEITGEKKRVELWWGYWANQIPWFSKWTRICDDSRPPFYRWFVGGETNLAYLCADWQLQRGKGNKIAIIWEGEAVDGKGEPREIRKITYNEIYRESKRVAYALKNDLKVGKDEIVTLYLPMIPELPLYMLATQRIGAAHSVVFSGFSAEGLATRIIDAKSRIVVTADFAYRRGKKINLKRIVDEAVEICEREGHAIEKVIVVKRSKDGVDWHEGRDISHDTLLSEIPDDIAVPCTPRGSEDFSFILYTSGTTGKPKAAQHSVGGYAVSLYATMKLVFDIRDEDIYFCTADIGWITGHSYVVYGPLMHGATIVMYEGAPDFPSVERLAEIIERYRVTILYTAPTAIRMLMKFDEGIYRKHDLKTLRICHSVGEPINPEAWCWYYRVFGNENVVCSSTWWMTETGCILTGHFPGLGKIFPMKPGTNGYPIPPVKMKVLDEDGNELPPGKRGYLVVTTPWPGMLMTLYNDPERFVEVYFGKYKEKGYYYYAGDFAVIDQDGYIWGLGRADDVLKVAGHRIGSAEVESAMVKHSAVAEAACVGKSDPVKGEIPLIFAVLRKDWDGGNGLHEDLKNHLRTTIGAFVASDATIVFIDLLPKTRSGKIMRRLLRAVAEGRPLGDVTTLESEVAVEEAIRAYKIVKEALSSQSIGHSETPSLLN